MLFLLRARGGAFHPHNCMMEILNGGDPSRGKSDYPREKRLEINVAISEAFAWLGAQGLIVAKPGDTGGWMILSRRAQRFESEEDVRQFRMARSLNRDLLHLAIAEKVWLAFVRGDFAEAVFTAMRAVEIAVREAAGFFEGDHGVPMIRRAFHKDTGPLRDPGQEEAEREALMHLFAGAVGASQVWRGTFEGTVLNFGSRSLGTAHDGVARPAYPPLRAGNDGRHLFRAFNGINPDQVRVVVIGQDPYPERARATGRAFEGMVQSILSALQRA